ncbi:VanZ family protein [Saccharibacillus sp. JS10]|uniref:VanZ family protein n=1 Tax=Saccharibacillus sp. JS10 TaxID=2950552 RepID=UPI00210C5A1E|nr:VanZ family protein [Saccharibacillus sp. JS10]MCQ4087811.1 VanZ family protein [Saccharibacillus sp. JS10]
MISKNWHRLTRIFAICYFALLFFFLFVGFDRSSGVSRDGYFYNFAVEPIVPFQFSGLLHNPFMLFQLGNYLAFIPCGLLLPYLRGWGFLRLTATFLVGMTIVETTQMLTGLGRFDVNDIIINALGYLTGYAAWTIGKLFGGKEFSLKRWIYTASSCTLLIALFLAAPSIVERTMQLQTEGTEIPLANLSSPTGNVRWEQTPQELLNTSKEAESSAVSYLHAWSEDGTEILEYPLDGNYVRFYTSGTVEGGTGGSARFLVDGEVVYEFSYQGEEGQTFDIDQVELDVRHAQRLKIELTKPDENVDGKVMLWDARLLQRKNADG